MFKLCATVYDEKLYTVARKKSPVGHAISILPATATSRTKSWVAFFDFLGTFSKDVVQLPIKFTTKLF